MKTLTLFTALISAAGCLQRSDIPSDTPLASLLSTAKTYLANGAPGDALSYFDEAVSRDPSNYLILFQRGATYLSLGKSSKALADFDRVLQLKPKFEGALIQRARLRTRAGDWVGAKKDYLEAGRKNSHDVTDLEAAQKTALAAERAEKKKDWDMCVEQAGVAITKANSAVSLRQLRAKCQFERGEIEQGSKDLVQVLQLAPSSVTPHLQVSAMMFYSLADTERGLAQIRKCLHSDPDSKECGHLFRSEKRISKKLDNLFSFKEKKKFSKAAELLAGNKDGNGLLDDIKKDIGNARNVGYIHPNAPNSLYVDLVEDACLAFGKVNNKQRAEFYCQESLKLNPTALHGLLFRAQQQIDADKFEEAIQTLSTAHQHHENSEDVRNLMQKAHVLLKRSKQKDYYKVLEVDRDADEKTIKRAYRRLVKIYHPDKALSKGIPKEESDKKMAALNEAYEVLSTPELRARFDRGDDPNDPNQGGNPFQGGSPFGNGQPFMFQQDGGTHFKFSRGFQFQGGFPGGFPGGFGGFPGGFPFG